MFKILKDKYKVYLLGGFWDLDEVIGIENN
jgi:hypothetical protein